jgi:predicted nucleotidyltransferase
MTIQTQTLESALHRTGLDIVMLAEYGSRADGTATADSDHDVIGIYVESDAQIYGLDKASIENFRLHPDGRLETMGIVGNESRSASDVVELSLRPLRTFVSLAAGGNATALSTLWSSETIVRTSTSDLLVKNRDVFLSKHAARCHAGYGENQRNALLGLTNKRTNRPELSNRHGYDTKYASHMIRVLLVGLNLVRDRAVHLPMKPEQVELLLEIRNGELTLADAVALSEKLHSELIEETAASDLPDRVDFTLINDLLRIVRNEHLDR